MIIDIYDKLILHANESPFKDSSPARHTITNNNAVTLSSTESKFGPDSANFVAASTQSLSADYNADFDFAAGDFTLETWVWATDTTGNEAVISARTGDNYTGFVILRTTSLWKWYATASGSSWDISDGKQFGTATAGQWDHLCVAREGSNFRIFLNGVAGQGTSDAATMITPSTMTIGANGDGSHAFDGYMQEIRISKGIARRTANFTPPTSPYRYGRRSSMTAVTHRRR